MYDFMRIIDTHTHIYDAAFDADRDAVVRRAREAGVGQVLLPNEDSGSYAAMRATQAAYPDFCRVMLGVHPTSVNEQWRREMEFFDDHIGDPGWTAVGEIGLDLYWDKSFLPQQKQVFEHQLAAAVEKGLPVSIHSREAFAETIASLRRFDAGRLRGVIHAFSGGAEQAREYSRLGDFYFGIGGVSTYKNARFVEQLPMVGLDRIVLETDAPYLTPVPMRGHRNEPAYLVHVAGRLAQVFGLDAETVAETTSQNAEKLFF